MESSSSERPERVDIGFYGTQVLSVRMSRGAYDELRAALERTEGRSWHEVETDDAVVCVDVDKVVYLRREIEHERIGF